VPLVGYCGNLLVDVFDRFGRICVRCDEDPFSGVVGLGSSFDASEELGG
jgi:hypothetical protein